jgi:hypothetical protein
VCERKRKREKERRGEREMDGKKERREKEGRKGEKEREKERERERRREREMVGKKERREKEERKRGSRRENGFLSYRFQLEYLVQPWQNDSYYGSDVDESDDGHHDEFTNRLLESGKERKVSVTNQVKQC